MPAEVEKPDVATTALAAFAVDDKSVAGTAAETAFATGAPPKFLPRVSTLVRISCLVQELERARINRTLSVPSGQPSCR